MKFYESKKRNHGKYKLNFFNDLKRPETDLKRDSTTTIIVEQFLIEENNSYEDLVEEIKNQFPGVRGCSLRIVKRFCSQHGSKCQCPWFKFNET